MTELGHDLEVNRALWTLVNTEFTDERATSAWAEGEITWGIFEALESDIGVLGDVAGAEVVELGCGTAYLSAWLARRGARAVGIDLTSAQLETARRCQQQFGVHFPLVEADAAAVPFRDASFDLVISEYGASVWCDPERWIREAARLLRADGRLVFLTNSVLATLCVPEEEGETRDQLLRPQRDLNRVHWPGGGVEFHPGHGDWIRVLRANGFVIEGLHELYATAAAKPPDYYTISSARWASQWPSMTCGSRAEDACHERTRNHSGGMMPSVRSHEIITWFSAVLTRARRGNR